MRKSIPLLLALVLVGILASVSRAGVPRLMTYQGVLEDASNKPLRNQTVVVQFTIYADAGGVSALWTEIDTVTTDKNGAFSLELGLEIPIPDLTFDGTVRWLGIRVVPDPSELIPRARIVSNAYSYHSRFADTASVALSPVGSGWVDDGPVVRLDSPDDSVGIGTATPGEKLHLEGGRLLMGISHYSRNSLHPGDIIFDNGTAIDLPGIKFYHGDNQNFGIDLFDHPTTQAGLRFTEELDESGGQTRMIIKEGGNVGIGELVPSEKLDVAGVIRSSSGGFKFPDGSVQTSAASPGTGIVPIGSVVAWMKSLGGVPSLTQDSNFVECNGQTIIDIASPLNGVTIPDLNSQSRFLRGSLVSGGSGGSDEHNHQWFLRDRFSYDPGGVGTVDMTVGNKGLNSSSPPFIWYTTDQWADMYTKNNIALPSYFAVVWIMRIK